MVIAMTAKIGEYGTRKLPPCRDKKPACTGYAGGRFKILDDTHFKRPCPFYKTVAMIRELEKGINNG